MADFLDVVQDRLISAHNETENAAKEYDNKPDALNEERYTEARKHYYYLLDLKQRLIIRSLREAKDLRFTYGR
jgi:hypothetical protein